MRKRTEELKEEARNIVTEMKILRTKWCNIMKQRIEEVQDFGNMEEDLMESVTSKFYSNFYMKFHNFIINVFLCR